MVHEAAKRALAEDEVDPFHTLAEIITAEYAPLVEAATLALRWLSDPLDSVKRFEDIAEWFYRETGYLRPGKDDARGLHTDEERRERFERWCQCKQVLIRANLRDALRKVVGDA